MSGVQEELKGLEEKVKKTPLPAPLAEKAIMMIKRAAATIKYGGYFVSYEQVSKYIDWITSLPWEKESVDTLDLASAKQILDKNHYGLEEIKNRILEYLAVMKLKRQRGRTEKGKIQDRGVKRFMRAPILCFVGLVGTGKTTIAYSIAEAMGRKFARIPFGGMGSALDLRGQSRVHPDAEVGLVMKALRRVGVKNSVILLDEIDRVAEGALSDIMGVLVELLDPEQNIAFTDHFIDYPFDLSQVLFITTANNTSRISTAVLDRLEPIQMPSYSDEEKIVIGKDYIFPKVLEEAGLTKEDLKIEEDVWPLIVRPLGFDAGIRTLERTINGICRKAARLIVEGKNQSFYLTKENIKQFLPTW